MWDRQLIVPERMTRNYRDFGYAPAIRTGPFLHIAGQVGRNEDFELVSDPRGQIRQAWDNLGAVLEAAGAERAHLVDIVTYHVDLADHLAVFKEERDRFLGPELATRPCWTAIGVSSLSRPGMIVEIKASAFIPHLGAGA
jgi:enamine deaminase RidA (YjgF/YER057c/UK114 family)